MIADPDTVALLVQRHRQGDPHAASVLLEKHLWTAREIVAATLGPHSPLRTLMDSQDVLQEALTKAYRGLDRADIASAGQFRCWLAQIVENTIRDAARTAGRAKRDYTRLERGGEDVERLAAIAANDPTPSEVAMGRERWEQYLAALMELDERQRAALVFHRHGGMTYAEIADSLELGSESSARTLLSRGLARLSEILDVSE